MEEYNPQEVAEKIMEALQKARKNMKNLNIMVMENWSWKEYLNK